MWVGRGEGRGEGEQNVEKMGRERNPKKHFRELRGKTTTNESLGGEGEGEGGGERGGGRQ